MGYTINAQKWKRYITQLQLAQFIYLGFHHLQPLLLGNYCGASYPTLLVFTIQNIFMICLFGDFYYRSYVCNSKKQSHKNMLEEEKVAIE